MLGGAGQNFVARPVGGRLFQVTSAGVVGEYDCFRGECGHPRMLLIALTAFSVVHGCAEQIVGCATCHDAGFRQCEAVAAYGCTGFSALFFVKSYIVVVVAVGPCVVLLGDALRHFYRKRVDELLHSPKKVAVEFVIVAESVGRSVFDIKAGALGGWCSSALNRQLWAAITSGQR